MSRPTIRLGGGSRSSFHVCGITGLVMAIVVGVALTAWRALPLWVLGMAVLTAVATFLSLALVTKALVGEERLIYYHHEVAILATVTLMLWLFRQPVLAYLDATLLGVGAFLFCGRVGCFMVGCCHGRPHRHGVCYRDEHADAGFTRAFVSIRLFPVQLVESAWVFSTVVVGIVLVLRGAAPGVALAWYIVVYDIGRFGFEFVRGDIRPYRGGFSEAQWTSLLLLMVVVQAELRGAIPLRPWHLAAAAGMVATMVVVTLHRRLRRDARHRLLSARHIHEVAEALHLLSARGESVPPPPDAAHWPVTLASTSAGFQLSAGRAEAAHGEVRHYTLSSALHPLTDSDARCLARMVLLLRHSGEHGEVVPGREGIFHLIVEQPQASRRPIPRPRMSHDQPHPVHVR
jgi:Prolipoprotein diacylglyceryl transferase